MLIQLLKGRLRTRLKPVLLLVALQAAQAVATLYLPTLNADLIDHGVLTGAVGHILRVGAVMTAITLAQVCCALGAGYLAAAVALAVGRDLRTEVFARVHAFSAREVAHFGAPSLLTRTTNDPQQVQAVLLLALTLLVPAPIMCAGGIVLALDQDLPLSGLLVAAVPVLGVLIGLIMHRMGPLSRGLQERVDTVNRLLREQIAGIRVIRAFVRDDHEQRRFAAANGELATLSLRVGRLGSLLGPAVMLVVNLSSLAVLWFGAQRIDHGQLRLGALTAFLSYLTQILMSVMMATLLFMVAPRAQVCAERIHQVLATEPALAAPARPVTAAPAHGRLELVDVEFRYPGAEAPVLRGVRLTVRPGETTAVVGSTGSGKSTLVQLVPRLLDPTAGQVLIDGVDVRRLDPAALAATVGWVPQQPQLFTGTVAENLRYGRPGATDEELWQALEVAQAREFVAALPAGLATPVAQGGAGLSGGQRQRLCIARSLVVRPKVLLLDDAFAALDAGTDAALRAALQEATASAAVLLVAQRISTVLAADQIVVLDRGRVVATGTHHELLAASTTYREITFSQLAEQEAA
ncbi:ABC transporter ATP-binding protein [Kitasatospora sp. GAS1066B]|uniref:ABC transporter ATP-binding protein n=1 Tax=Kitasatospora sp. GAS1066B TaxID=3156271 RepID=UPI003519C1E6